ncbi:hypothetical protein BDQ17DRAFT_1545393 [Cyathus striatus]|nr:hypothetical protein BDQ17DRAFT_1545393 [Cyathus striatus]
MQQKARLENVEREDDDDDDDDDDDYDDDEDDDYDDYDEEEEVDNREDYRRWRKKSKKPFPEVTLGSVEEDEDGENEALMEEQKQAEKDTLEKLFDSLSEDDSDDSDGSDRTVRPGDSPHTLRIFVQAEAEEEIGLGGIAPNTYVQLVVEAEESSPTSTRDTDDRFQFLFDQFTYG